MSFVAKTFNTPTINETGLFQTLPLPAQINQIIFEFLIEQRKDGRAEETIRTRIQALKQVARACDILYPEVVKGYLANCKWSNKTKVKFVDTYSAFLKYRRMTWTPPKYRVISKIPYVPTEMEIDILISACGKTTSTVLLTLKETGIRIGELCQLKWTDLDGERKTLNITPEKGSNPRILPISNKLIGMINRLSRNRPTIFQPKKRMLREYYCTQRKAIAERLQNPRLLEISFHTFRHWKGIMEYHKTKDIIHVKQVLGHKSITSTLVYINIESALFLSDTDNFTCKVAHNEAEAIRLIEAGFQYVNNLGDQCALYKKRK
jgi:integrase